MHKETINQNQNGAVRFHLLQITIQPYDTIDLHAPYQL